MNPDEKFNLITRNLEEVLTQEELKSLIASGTPLKHYIGLEISGKAHVGWIFMMKIIKDLQDAGVETQVLLADWHTWLNKKLDGTLKTAKRLGRDYFEQALKACALCAGADPDKINFILGSEIYEKLGSNYWATVIKVAKATTLARMIRSTTIMGRKESEISDTAMLIYPAMQSADIFALGANIAHAGTDQRNVHVVAREAAASLGEKKPVAIHHHLLQGLLQPVLIEENGKQVMDMEAAKMSKSKPDSAIFIHDSDEEVKRKINNAYCPEGVVEFNPILDWVKYLIFYQSDSKLEIKRPEKFGGDITYTSYEDLEKDYAEKKLHPQDLKMAVAEWLNNKLEPARKYFEDPKRKSALEEIERLTTK
ncbi:tyrosine--tRNA ligase [Candidatus Daviesbacteria bacterium RIFCSPLOWO2_02_FULL_36_7]|uniref:Tyrosine--tRNA ligase n=1 Tax=Candidatus Daviesbacteria bacterium RIFCSPLOWO2_02_FULL_36_7 TaxID=1797792 RepID=A0A1F5MG52_9BACT|nr:MAG: tyrosine--tRNA ligase [Candidatus Daviesbacteria bacterium RIFCSPLOWO2_02_FULL_36_7]